MPNRRDVSDMVAGHRPGFALPGPLYTSGAAHRADLEAIWYHEWVFAGHEAELAAPASYLTLQIGDYPIIVVRDRDGSLNALHNVCRHRGSRLCDDETGSVGRRITCPYHQWTYELNGALTWARSMPDDLEPDQLALGRAHCASIGGLVFVCLAEGSPPDIEPVRALLGPYLAPYGLAGARVAHGETIVEQGNWKLVMENNRECYHCRNSHPELCRTFPEAPLHSGGGTAAEVAATAELVERCEAAGLPSRFRISDDHSYRAMRMAFTGGAQAMTMDGKPAVASPFPGLPEGNLGDVLLYHYPSTWIHVMGDHAVTFRILPTSPTTTELRTVWLVPGTAVEGVDYDRRRLTEVWSVTNAQDSALVARTQLGVASPAFRPGPYSPVEEDGVSQFVQWYTGLMRRRLARADAGADPRGVARVAVGAGVEAAFGVPETAR